MYNFLISNVYIDYPLISNEYNKQHECIQNADIK